MNATEKRYLFQHGSYPRRPQWLRATLADAASRLEAKLTALSLPGGAVSPFTAAYLASKMRAVRANLQHSTYLLAWALAPVAEKKDLGRIVLIDYGAGIGDITLLAKEAGVGTVIHNDLFDVMSRDARTLSEATGLVADHYVTGAIDDLLACLDARNLKCDAVVCNDAIEHIYDIHDFLRKIPAVGNGHLSAMFATAANPRNPLIARRLMRLQRKMEQVGTTRQEGEDPRDTAEAYLPLRRRMITDINASIPSDVGDEIARRTRGMRQQDVAAAVEKYRSTGMLPPEPAHPTNTCDPFTGNWCEQLLDPDHVAAALAERGLRTRTLPGYYGSGAGGSKLKRMARIAANMTIRVLGRGGIRIAPFYCVVAERGANA